MNTLYFISMAITASLSVFITLAVPTIKRKYRQYNRAKKQKLNELIRAEVENQLKQIIND